MVDSLVAGRRLFALCAFILLVLRASASLSAPNEPQKKAETKPAKEQKPYTVTYDVSDLIHKPGGKHGYDTIDDLLRVFMPILAEDGAKAGVFAVQEVHGTTLEVHTTKALHAEVTDLLMALRRLADVAVDVTAELLETERAFYEKEILPKVGGDKARLILAPVDEQLAKALGKHSPAIRRVKTRIADGREARIFSLRKAFTYKDVPQMEKPFNQRLPLGVGLQGTVFHARMDVSPDRRFVRLRISQHVSELMGLMKRNARDPNDPNKDITLESPNLNETTVAESVEVEDGKLVLMPVRHLPPEVKAKDRVLILLARPVIYIEEEQKERRKGAKGARN